MTQPQSILCEYQGEGEFKAVSTFWENRADKDYVIGERYNIAPREDRSHNSHAHYFASVTEAWKNLPDALAEQFPTPDHLRRYALIRAGFCDVQHVTCSTKAEALRWAKIARELDEYSLVVIESSVVSIHRARSQSYRAMPKGEFQRSKDEVMRVIAEMIGVSADTLSTNAARAA